VDGDRDWVQNLLIRKGDYSPTKLTDYIMLLFVEMLPEKMTLFRENNDTRRIIIVPCDMGDEILRYKSFLTVGKKKDIN